MILWIESSTKDRLVLKYNFIIPENLSSKIKLCNPTSENSHSALIENIDFSKYEKIVINFDCDQAGIKNANILAQKIKNISPKSNISILNALGRYGKRNKYGKWVDIKDTTELYENKPNSFIYYFKSKI